MRLSADKIKQAILHPEERVRITAVEYFSESFSDDAGVMPFIIEAVKKYGRADAYKLAAHSTGVRQTDASVEWILQELSGAAAIDSSSRKLYYSHLARVLKTADPEILLPCAQRIKEAPHLPPEIRASILQSLDMHAWDSRKCWEALERVCEEGANKQYVNDIDMDYVENVIAALSRKDGQDTDKILRLLSRDADWMEPFMVILAGRMKLAAAVPEIIRKLHIDGDYVNEQCITALERIGTDEVIEAVHREFPGSEWYFKLYASSVFEHIHTDLAVARALEFARAEKDLSIKTYLARALLTQFSSEGLDFAYDMVRKRRWDRDYCDLQSDLLIAGMVMGKVFREQDRWTAEMRADNERLRKIEGKTIFGDNDDSTGHDIDEDVLEPPPLMRARKLGRNDPCYCGSGKKYKKCCGR